MDTYTEAHLFVAAIRILQHLNGSPPRIEDVSTMLGISVESAHTICRNLKKLGIVETFEDPFSVKLAVANHLEIEKIPRKAAQENTLAKELEKFQAGKKDLDQKIADIQAEMAKKKKEMFAGLDAMFKKEAEKGKR
jgi:DNA-binding Lrp family transcriptional regulator